MLQQIILIYFVVKNLYIHNHDVECMMVLKSCCQKISEMILAGNEDI